MTFSPQLKGVTRNQSTPRKTLLPGSNSNRSGGSDLEKRPSVQNFELVDLRKVSRKDKKKRLNKYAISSAIKDRMVGDKDLWTVKEQKLLIEKKKAIDKGGDLFDHLETH